MTNVLKIPEQTNPFPDFHEHEIPPRTFSTNRTSGKGSATIRIQYFEFDTPIITHAWVILDEHTEHPRGRSITRLMNHTPALRLEIEKITERYLQLRQEDYDPDRDERYDCDGCENELFSYSKNRGA